MIVKCVSSMKPSMTKPMVPPHMDIVFQIFLDTVRLVISRLFRKSAIKVTGIWSTNMAKYGNEDRIPSSLISNLSTVWMNVGISVNSSQKPQLWPMCAKAVAHTGNDVNMDFHGVSDNWSQRGKISLSFFTFLILKIKLN